jgi:DNA-binding transcriptional ArsR family regulator
LIFYTGYAAKVPHGQIGKRSDGRSTTAETSFHIQKNEYNVAMSQAASIRPSVDETIITGTDAGTFAPPRDPATMLSQARQATDLLKALSHEGRLVLLCMLCERERSVGELEALVGQRQATVSQQLARLRLDGLVTTRRDGKTVYYRIADENVRRLIGTLYEMFCGEAKGGRGAG